jgi:cytochrome P450
VFGRNVVATIGEEWKRHRKITVRTFSHKTMQLVHAETVKQTSQMMACWEKGMKHGNRLVVER